MQSNKYAGRESDDPSLMNITNVIHQRHIPSKYSPQNNLYFDKQGSSQMGNHNQSEGGLAQNSFTPYKDEQSDQYDDLQEPSPQDQYELAQSNQKYYSHNNMKNFDPLSTDKNHEYHDQRMNGNSDLNMKPHNANNSHIMGHNMSHSDNIMDIDSDVNKHFNSDLDVENINDNSTNKEDIVHHQNLIQKRVQTNNNNMNNEDADNSQDKNSQDEDNNGGILPDQIDEIWKDQPLINPLLYKPASKPPVIREGDWLCPDSTCSSKIFHI